VSGSQSSEEDDGGEGFASLLAYLNLWQVNPEIHKAVDGLTVVSDGV
jgi:hypothetical protein